jgi:hypothetical protein
MAATIVTIPVAAGVPHQSFTLALDGRRFEVRLNWIQRVRRWALDLATDSGESLMRCKFLATRADTLRQIRSNPDAPQGCLSVVDTENQDTEASLATLGRRHALIYLTDGLGDRGEPLAEIVPE